MIRLIEVVCIIVRCLLPKSSMDGGKFFEELRKDLHLFAIVNPMVCLGEKNAEDALSS